MTPTHDLYRRWLDELRGGTPGAAQPAAIVAQTRAVSPELALALQGGPIGRPVGTGTTPDGPVGLSGNDVLRVAQGRSVEYWAASSSGS